jgi:hypothetical protein
MVMTQYYKTILLFWIDPAIRGDVELLILACRWLGTY